MVTAGIVYLSKYICKSIGKNFQLTDRKIVSDRSQTEVERAFGQQTNRLNPCHIGLFVKTS
jgi:hypothetical protein